MRISKVWALVKRFNAMPLFIILILSVFLTFFILEKRSLLDWDEAYYMNIIKTWRAGADWFAYKIFNPEKIMHFGLSDYVLEYGGAINTFAKDGFLALVFLFSYLFGTQDTAILRVSGLFGILTVLITYLIGKVSFGMRAGLLSSGILAISILQLHYSRSGFPQATSVFFLYLAALIYIFSYQSRNNVKTSGRLLFFSAISLGYSFTCHYNLFWALPAFLVLEMVAKTLYGKEIPIRYFFRRVVLLSIGASIPILFFGGISELIKLILNHNSSFTEAIRGSLDMGVFVSYFERIINFITPSLSIATLIGNCAYSPGQHISPFYYLKILLLWEGPLILVLLLIGLIFLIYRQIHRRIFTEFVILILFLFPFLYWSFHPWQVSRSFVAAIPALALIIGFLLTQVIEKCCKNESSKTTAVFIILLILIFNAYGRLKKELSYESGYPVAIRFMREHSGIKHLSSQFTISRSFVGRKNALDISSSFKGVDPAHKLQELYDKHGYRYLLLDQMRYAFADSPIVKAADMSKPIFVVPHSTCANLFDNHLPGFADKVSRAPQVLMVYDLADILNNLKNSKTNISN